MLTGGGPTVTINRVKAAVAAALYSQRQREARRVSQQSQLLRTHVEYSVARSGCFWANRLATSLLKENMTGIPERKKKLSPKPPHCNSLNSCFLTVKPRLTLTDKGVLMQQA